MVKALPCPHVHAGSALVHQAEQAHPLHARSGGSGGAGRVAHQRGPRPAGERLGREASGLVSVSTSCTNLCAGYDFVCLLLTKVPF